jgi:hypothetical protein
MINKQAVVQWVNKDNLYMVLNYAVTFVAGVITGNLLAQAILYFI